LTDKIDDVKNGYSNFKEKDFREYQKSAIEFIVGSGKKVTVACLPTGAGKSLIGTVAAGVLGAGTYLVHSRALQVQLQEDFPELPILWGRGNYECLRSERVISCAECSHTKSNPCPNKASRCEYVTAKRIALQAPVRILNYDYWITEANYVGSFGDEEFVIIDEADALEGVMAKFVGLEFSEGMMRNLGLATPKYKTTASEKSLDDWRSWANTALFKVNRKLVDVIRIIGDYESDPELIRRKEKLSGILRKLKMFIECVDDTWLYEEKDWDGKRSISFKPTWITRELAEKYVWEHGRKFVLMSATFPPLPVLAKVLGLSMGDIAYREFPSTFPVENRPVNLKPVANLVYKDMEVESVKVVNEVRRLLEVHKEEKGLIHVVSYKLSRMVMDIGDPRLITHNGGNKIDIVEEFKNSELPLVMVSPSSERGISLDGEMCRWICWVKAPFLSLADKLVKARIYKSSVGSLWYKSNALMAVVQGCGRAVRSKEDHAVTYILDQQIVKLLTENPGLVPKWFLEAVW
jgi:ATP-dependent DNA helicase DinG